MNDYDYFAKEILELYLPKRHKTILLRLIEEYLVKDGYLNENDINIFRKTTLSEISSAITYYHWGPSFWDPFALYAEYFRVFMKNRIK
jgi:hypothetical protein